MGKIFSAQKMNIFLLMAMFLIAGCGTGGLADTASAPTDNDTGGTGSGSITFSIVKSADQNTATTAIDPDNPAVIKATAKDSNGALIVGKVMQFTSTFDIKFQTLTGVPLSDGTVLTDSTGTAKIKVVVGASAGAATINASISSGGVEITGETGLTVNLQPPPAVPTSVTLTAVSSSQINLQWVGPGDAAGYKVYKVGVEIPTSVSTTSLNDTGLSASTQYCYNVTSFDALGNESSKSSQVCTNTYGAPPSVPTGLAVSATSPTQVDLSWTATTGAAQYKIYRNGVMLGTAVTAPATTYSDTSAIADTLYAYTVTAVDSTGSESAQTASGVANTGLTVPNNVQIQVDSASQITVSWGNSGGTQVARYNVYRDGELYLPAVSALIAVDGGLTENTRYCYSVSATNALGTAESAKSSTVCGRTLLVDATPAPVAYLSLGTNQISVKTDNSDSATITAYALDSSRAVIEGTFISFSTTGGAISGSTVATDANGKATITFSSGLDKINQTVTITANASGISGDPPQIPIQISGSTLTLTSTSTTISAGGAAATLTVTAKDAGGNAIYNAPVTLTPVAVVPQGAANLSATSGTTDISGVLRDSLGALITVSGTSSGTYSLRTEGVGDVQTIDYTVMGASDPVFAITSPTGSPITCDTTSSKTVTVRTSSLNQTVWFSTTLGEWDGAAFQQYFSKTGGAAGSTVSAVLTSAVAGTATVQVYVDGSPSTSDSIPITFYAPAASAAQIDLQANPTTIRKSTAGSASNTTTLTATVRSAANQVVGNAPVLFTIENPVGGGESISPVVVYTNNNGIATSTFYSGTLTTGATASSLTIKAAVAGTAFSDTTDIIIGGTAGSVVVGYGNAVTSSTNSTYYTLPMSVLVADSSGSPVGNQQVSLDAWPYDYAAVSWYIDFVPSPDIYLPYVARSSINEDSNENLVKDAGEDINGDGFLTPPNSAAGALPATVTTDANGVASFSLTYLKSSAVSIKARVRASTVVSGTEMSSALTFRLPYEKVEGDNGNLTVYSTPITLKAAMPVGGGNGTATCQLNAFYTGTANTFSPSVAAGAVCGAGGAPAAGSSCVSATGQYIYTVLGGTASGTKITDRVTINDTVGASSVAVDVEIYVF